MNRQWYRYVREPGDGMTLFMLIVLLTCVSVMLLPVLVV